jgi:hypothetical protein
MWGDWVEKAKAVAQNIDQQINESVGLDVTEATTASPLSIQEASRGKDGAGGDNNVWDDDFDFDDDDDDDEMEAQPADNSPGQEKEESTSSTKQENNESAAELNASGIADPMAHPSTIDNRDVFYPGGEGETSTGMNSEVAVEDRDHTEILQVQIEENEQLGENGDDHNEPSFTAEKSENSEGNAIQLQTGLSDQPKSAEMETDHSAQRDANGDDSDWQEDHGLVVEEGIMEGPHIEHEDEDRMVKTAKSLNETKETEIQEVEEFFDQDRGQADVLQVDISERRSIRNAKEKAIESSQSDQSLPQVQSEDQVRSDCIDTSENVHGMNQVSAREGWGNDELDMSDANLEVPIVEESPDADKDYSKTEIKSALNSEITEIQNDRGHGDDVYQENKRLVEMLLLREQQLESKSQQLAELNELLESQESDLKKKIQETKEEAKKRIQKAKERCEAAESRLKQVSATGSDSSKQKEELIAALRQEGENLARKQSEMERAVRTAKAEARDLQERLEAEMQTNEEMTMKSVSLETELKRAKEQLTAARKGESLSGKLEQDLLSARQESDERKNTILSLEQKILELTSQNKELNNEVDKAKKLAAKQATEKQKELDREHSTVLSDLENKLRISERESAAREDALRHEVTELRKRWQDAVRRADGKA